MPLIPRRPFRRRDDGRFDVNLDADERDLLRGYLDQLRDLLLADDPNLRRLFPVVHPDDPAREADYQALARAQLLESRFATFDAVEATLDRDVLDEAELTAWMQSVNALRLVLGTVLDVREDEPFPDPDDPRADAFGLYEALGSLLGLMVRSLTEALPDGR